VRRFIRKPAVAVALPLVALSLAACGSSDGTVLELRVDNAPGAQDPQYLMLDWLDGTGSIMTGRRVPGGTGMLGNGTPLARIRIEITSRGDGVRKAVVRGFIGEEIVSEGTTQLVLPDAARINASVTLQMGRRSDRDRDNVPDEIDGCPDDPAFSGPCPGVDASPPDGGPPDDGAVPPDDGPVPPPPPREAGAEPPGDGGVDRPDNRPDAPAPEVGPEAPRDVGGDVDIPVNMPVPFPCGTALLVTSSVGTALDRPLVARLTQLGCNPAQISDGMLAATDATGKSVVVVSDTVDGSLVRIKLKTVATPVLVMRPDIQDDNAMTGPGDGTDWARNSTEALMTISDPTHPLAAGLSGTVAFTTQPWPIGWGRCEATAAKVGTFVGNPTRCLLYGYETGTPMTGGFAAPARRVGFPVHADGVAKLNGNGWALFDAAIRWATGH
jgi:hypothetical protein